MNYFKIRKRFESFKAFLENESPEVRKAATGIVKALSQLPSKKEQKSVILKVIEKLNQKTLTNDQ